MRRYDHNNSADLLSGAGRFYFGVGDLDVSLLDDADVEMMEGLVALMFARFRIQVSSRNLASQATSAPGGTDGR